jgi:hypothetical protein
LSIRRFISVGEWLGMMGDMLMIFGSFVCGILGLGLVFLDVWDLLIALMLGLCRLVVYLGWLSYKIWRYGNACLI